MSGKGVQDPKALLRPSTQGDAFEKTAQELAGQGKAADAKDYHLFAQRAYQLAVEMDGENPSARFKLAQSLYQNADPKNAKQNFREARLHLKQAIRNETDNKALVEIARLMEQYDKKEFANAWDSVGHSLVDFGKFKEAKEFYQSARTRTLAIADAASQMGDEAQFRKLSDKAQFYLEQSQLADERQPPPTPGFDLSEVGGQGISDVLIAFRAQPIPLGCDGLQFGSKNFAPEMGDCEK
jgi:tetratricopeptide (TPR) repeat protein